MPLPIWVRVLTVAVVILMVLVAWAGGDPAPIAEAYSGFLIASIPGIIFGVIAGGIATEATQSLPIGGTAGTVTYFVIYIIIRYGILGGA